MSAIQLFDKNGELRFDGTEVGGGGSQPFRWAGPFTIAFDTAADHSGSGFRQYQRLAAIAEGEILCDSLAFLNVLFAGSDADSVSVLVGIYDDYFDDPTSGSIDIARSYFNLASKGPMYGPTPTDFHHEAMSGAGNFTVGFGGNTGPNMFNPMLAKRTDLIDPAETRYFAAELDWEGIAPTAGEVVLYALIATLT